MKKGLTIRSILFKKAYLLIGAAWFITLTFIVDNYWTSNASIDTVQQKISSYVQQSESDFEQEINKSSFITQCNTGKLNKTLINAFNKKSYFLFVFKNNSNPSNDLFFWNTSKILPPPYLRYQKDSSGFLALENGYYVWNKKSIGNLVCISLIPIKWNYFIENNYLVNNFAMDHSFTGQYNISSNPNEGLSIKNKKGQFYFSVYELAKIKSVQNNKLAIFFAALGLLGLIVFLHQCAADVYDQVKKSTGLWILFLGILALRTLFFLHWIPIDLNQLDLFNSMHFFGGYFIPSLGDLMLHGIAALWFVLFFRNRLTNHENNFTGNKWFSLLGRLLVPASLIFTAFVVANIIKNLVSHSDVSFNAIRFFTLNANSVVGFFIIAMLVFFFFLISQCLFYIFQKIFGGTLIQLLVAVSILSMGYLSFQVGNIKGGFEIFISIWLIFYCFIAYGNALILSKNPVSTRQIFWFAFFSVSVSIILLQESEKKELNDRRNYAKSLAIRSNPVNESMVNSSIVDLKSYFLSSEFYRFFDSSSNLVLKDSLIKSASSSYSNNYDTKIYTYNAEEKSLFNKDVATYNELSSILFAQAKPTRYNELFYFDQSFDLFSFIFKKEVKDSSNNLLGYFIWLSNPKSQKNDALYPELFSKGNDLAIENSKDYAIAMYKDGKLVSSFNDYPFSVFLKAEIGSQKDAFEINKDGKSEWWQKAGPGKWVVIARTSNLFIEAITLFSYIFCVILILASFIWVIMQVFGLKLNKKELKKLWYLSIRNQIQGTILFISAVSFVIIGFATIVFFYNRYQTTNREKLSRVMRILDKEVKLDMKNHHFNFNTATDSSGQFQVGLETTLQKISEIHGVDVNIYDASGTLKFSSFSLPYQKGILSNKINPIAFHHLNRLNESQFFQEEKIGTLQFISHYIPVIDENGVALAYLNIPYFTSETVLRQEISNFLITIINLNAFIFLLAGIIALFITNRIAQSFSFIAKKMQEVDLGMHNEPIVWDRNDEIGALVKQYNKMVAKLEEGAATLAKTEREGAWREMAKQVAHEIKNPLTPMKLSMQFLEKAINQHAPNVEALAINVSKTLIQQIDHLSNIANAFSQFANIGDPQKEVFALHPVLTNVVNLLQISNNIVIPAHLIENNDDIWADKTQINRLFTNLIINALQSVPEDRAPEIRIRQYIIGTDLVTAIIDNGNGIPAEISSNIFTPNFTTKSSGTGLGLAMCKRIVEQSQGEIWFETQVGAGTTFFVRLPLQVMA